MRALPGLALATALVGPPSCEEPAATLEPSLPALTIPLPASAEPARPCSAPSQELRLAIDARDEAALDRCVPLRKPGPRVRCGSGEAELDLAELDRAVRPLDEATRAHVAAIVARGRVLGRRAQAFGLVGDSMTISGDFLRNFASNERSELMPEVAARLRVGRTSIVERYRGQPVEQLNGSWRDSFAAFRAAKSGMRAGWALAGEPSPLEQMIERISPAVAIVLYGGNDAAWAALPLHRLIEDFSRDLGRILDALETAGIVPVLNTLARHGHAPGIDDCGAREDMTNWRIAVQTNALSARVVEIACQRRLPLIDLRHALDNADAHGLGPDGVHLEPHLRGAARLTAAGLRCGANVRNYVTLKMLATLAPLVWP